MLLRFSLAAGLLIGATWWVVGRDEAPEPQTAPEAPPTTVVQPEVPSQATTGSPVEETREEVGQAQEKIVVGDETPASPLDGLQPRRPVNGLHGIETRSTLTYVDAPEQGRAFEAIYVFPDRARWEFELANGEKRRVYRTGDVLFYSQSGPSLELKDFQRDRLLGQLELRRALLLWPRGFEWKDIEEGKEVDLGLAGRLRATLDPDSGLPEQLALHASDGEQLESLRALTWREDRGRRWPASLQFWHGGMRLWDETFERAEPARYVDSFFVPADRRTSETPGAAVEGARRLQPSTSLRVDVPEKISWDEAVQLATRERERWVETLGQERISPRPTFELGPKGRPAAILLRIEPPLAKAPKGWSQVPARDGITSFSTYESLAELDASRMTWLRSQVPQGHTAKAPYVRIDTSAGRIQLVQPFEP